MRRDRWNTFAITGYTHDVAQDRASQGGVHLHQIRKASDGWQCRIKQSNGRHFAYSPVWTINDREGEAHFATAQQETE